MTVSLAMSLYCINVILLNIIELQSIDFYKKYAFFCEVLLYVSSDQLFIAAITSDDRNRTCFANVLQHSS